MAFSLYLHIAFVIVSVECFRLQKGSALGNTVGQIISSPVGCGHDPPWVKGSAQRNAILLRGETFRYDNAIDQSATYRTVIEEVSMKGEYSTSFQRAATQSQWNNLVRPLQDAGEEVDIFSETYVGPPLSWHAQLMAEFGGLIKVDLQLHPQGHNQATSLLAAVDSLKEYAARSKVWYKSIYIVRHDLVLKQDLAALASHEPDSFLFPFKTKGSYSDMIFVFPGRLFGCVHNVLKSKAADSKASSMKIADKFPKLVTIGTLVNGTYQTNPTRYTASHNDPERAANPVYDLLGRSRTDKSTVSFLEEDVH